MQKHAAFVALCALACGSTTPPSEPAPGPSPAPSVVAVDAPHSSEEADSGGLAPEGDVDAGVAESSDGGELGTLVETGEVFDPESGKKTPRFIGNVVIATLPGPLSDVKPIVLARASFRACYERALANEPEAAGKMLLELNVEPTGVVSHVRTSVQGELQASLELCIQRRGLKLKFPEVDAGVRSLAVPLTFSRKKLP